MSTMGVGSRPLVGRVKTNGIGCQWVRTPHSDIANDCMNTSFSARSFPISYPNPNPHRSCTPNTVHHWNTSSISFRRYAVRDIPPDTKLTLAYCDIFDSVAERAKSLAPYGITSCGWYLTPLPNAELQVDVVNLSSS
ncbi:hypothetical protein BT96DRAFT_1004338 [Gymnopus androsaceus JB14]|uniref:SET domain-containing protein n=1 Tax=Gymnopus androsaceus JB14 TaxID=1447944 RepID=A0A6A4GR66_9AGAR|nr:hypothetical protein BT96DRAFT_1004338 [Gymnopus androsaceus JB14]